MTRLIGIGVLAALFFSSTFVLNRAMSLEGGSWVWSASLRYVWMTVFLVAGMALTGRGAILRNVYVLFRQFWRFWLLAGTVAFGIFYAGISFAASYAPSWVVATTWQLTILASPLVLLAYGRRVPWRGVAFTLLIFAGIVLVNLAQASATDWQTVALGAVPVLIAAVAYPAGLQLVWEARTGAAHRIPRIAGPAMDDAFGRVLLLTLGSLPFWLVVVMVTQPPPPSSGQWLMTAGVALFSGIVATTLFVSARHLARSAYELAAVDATQAAEVIFSLLGEMILLGAVLPGWLSLVGIALTVLGLVLYMLAQGRKR